MKKKIGTIISLLTLFVIGSCSDSDTPIKPEVKKTSVYDEKLNDYIATNFYDYEFEWAGIKNLDSLNEGRSEGLSDSQEIRRGSLPNYSLESDGVLPSGNVLTGIGARVNSNNNVTTLTLEYRYLNSNGTLGPRYRIQYGTEPQYTPTEVWYAVPPDNKVITGVGFRARYSNMQTMWVYYRTVTYSVSPMTPGFTLTGLTQLVKVGAQSTAECEVSYTPNFGENENDKAIITGVGLRCDDNSNITTMKIMAAFMQP